MSAATASERRDGTPREEKANVANPPLRRGTSTRQLGTITSHAGAVLREAVAERAQWRDPSDLDVRTRAPKVVTAFRRVDQLQRMHEAGAISREQHNAAKRFLKRT